MLLVAAPMETIFSSTNLITWRTLGNADRAVAEADLALHVRQYFVGAKNNHEPGHKWVPGLIAQRNWVRSPAETDGDAFGASTST